MEILLDDKLFPVDRSQVEAAIQFWHAAGDRNDLFHVNATYGRIPRQQGGFPAFIDGAVVISVVPFPKKMQRYAGLTWNRTDSKGRIYAAVIALNLSTVLRSPEAYQQLLRHELGHVLGLADDGLSIRNLSIMQGVLRIGNNAATERDREIIEDFSE